jgi:phenylalanyl-tRNA synthetase beta chain
MLFSRDWLSDHVDLPEDRDELAAGLTSVGLAVEGLEETADGDLLLDVDVTTNRPDCMNHRGLAREVAVHWRRQLKPLPTAVDEAAERAADAVSVELDDPEGCPRYVARVLRGVTVGDSPEWLKRRLTALGLRPINNVVDVTNFVLWETGQPLHAFDLAKVAGPRITVRRATEGEKLQTLDGEERTLAPDVLVIADAERAVALAGIMGGYDSEVTGETVDVLLESAHFDRRRVRIGARRLGLHTDASHRFERGADPGGCAAAAARAAALIAELTGGEVLSGEVDARADDFEARFTASGRLSLRRLEAFAGARFETADVERWMGGLGFGLRMATGGDGDEGTVWHATAPTWRWYDVESGRGDGTIYEQDFFEEVLRHHGFDPIPSTLPAIEGSDGPQTVDQVRRERVRDHLAACGYAEAINYAFQSAEMDASLLPLGGGEAVPLANPLSELYALMRRSLVPNLVANARFNARRGVGAVRLFEVGHVFWRDNKGSDETQGGVAEEEAVAFVCGGSEGTEWDRPVDYDLFDLKGVAESLGEMLETPFAFRPAEKAGLLAGTAAEVLVRRGDGDPGSDEMLAGWIGRVDEEEVGYPLYAGELRTQALGAGVIPGVAEKRVVVPSRYPTVAADYTLTHAVDVAWAELTAVVEKHRPDELADYGLKVRYAGEGVPEGAVNTTLWFLYSHPERSLTHDEVNERQEALVGELEGRFGWGEG